MLNSMKVTEIKSMNTGNMKAVVRETLNTSFGLFLLVYTIVFMPPVYMCKAYFLYFKIVKFCTSFLLLVCYLFPL